MMSFYNLKKEYDSFNFNKYVNNVSSKLIENSLNKEILTELDFLNLLSHKASCYLEDMAQKANSITEKHFGKSVLLYTPLYVSNFCVNNCIYCGFSIQNKIKRSILTLKEVNEECVALSKYGIKHILLVTGENHIKSPVSYLQKCVSILDQYFDYIDLEVYPMDINEYLKLKKFGVHGLTIYQETYNENIYKKLHTKGAKSNYQYRLASCERAGHAGYLHLTVGALLGLNDFISEVFFIGLHARYLQKRFPQAEIGVSFPRLCHTYGTYQPKTIISNKHLVQAICAIRLFINRVNISISTRENHILRSNLIKLGVTKLSAGSSTGVGGYAKKNKTDSQFLINDHSSVEQVKKMVYKKGYQPILKDFIL